jgi:NDP-sugar pyrophosphorylase family protein
MILAAGEGTRLRPLTERVPKALVTVGGRPLLDRVLESLARAGATRIIVNLHHHEDQLRTYLGREAPGSVEIALSPEPGGPYDTGGGLFAAAPLFRERTPFLLHNVDVLSAIPLGELMERHGAGESGGNAAPGADGEPSGRSRGEGELVASLAVQRRDARRSLLFDDEGLMGWENRGSDRAPEGVHRVREPRGEVARFSFTGIHVVEPRIFSLSERTGVFSIITLYLELAAQGHRIRPLDVSGHAWIDVGTPERLEEAERRKGEWEMTDLGVIEEEGK